jgi:hypothetical protein
MTQFRKKPVVIEAITFTELVQFGRDNGANIVNDMPWSFQYKGHPITHENDECYLIPTLEGTLRFTPNDVLITGIQGEIYPCKKDIFNDTYELVEKTTELTFEEANEFLKIGECIALPEWSGFWFGKKNEEILVLTKEGLILNTPDEQYKQRNDWKVVTPNETQQNLLKEYFNEKPKELPQHLTFGNAVEALKQGLKVSRKGWNGLGMFLYLVPGSTFKVNREPLLSIYTEGTEINYRPHIDLKTADGSIATWSPSGSDALAEDWIIVE